MKRGVNPRPNVTLLKNREQKAEGDSTYFCLYDLSTENGKEEIMECDKYIWVSTLRTAEPCRV